MKHEPVWLSAIEASRRLGVTRATLYAYVSRGYLRSQAVRGATRERHYAREDVERLRRRAEERRAPDKAAARALDWGLPILESSITCIDGERLFYRGHDAIALSRTRSLAEVALLIWNGGLPSTLPPVRVPRAAAGTPRDRVLPFVARAQALLARAATEDPAAADLRPTGVARTGWRILHLLARAATPGAPQEATVEATLGRAWQVRGAAVHLLRGALILCADHELNVSAFTARCVASAGSSPYAVVVAALAALEGTRHGGASARTESMLASLRGARDPRRALAGRLQRGEPVDGFGHPLYREGDPRARALLEWLGQAYPRSAEHTFVLRVADAAAIATGERPNLDFALGALARVLRLPAGSALTIFAIGRTIGWIGHAIEQYASGQLIRPRARYAGVAPER